MSCDYTRLRLIPHVSGSRPRDLSTTEQETYHMTAESNQTPGYTKRNRLSVGYAVVKYVRSQFSEESVYFVHFSVVCCISNTTSY
jgi:hypothetical protein